MIEINWEEYKIHKQTKFIKDNEKDNFDILIDFLRSYYKITSVVEIFDTINQDEIGKMMLLKREINEIELFEKYLYKDIKF
ncbi:hypothetical protein [Sulfurimonas sp. HSL-1716]|uniref:hypothetical protein n=1 Tax=Hydrocurvibacter sulfurireducens TaxID=3131937 RepID=UPI0031F915A2